MWLFSKVDGILETGNNFIMPQLLDHAGHFRPDYSVPTFFFNFFLLNYHWINHFVYGKIIILLFTFLGSVVLHLPKFYFFLGGGIGGVNNVKTFATSACVWMFSPLWLVQEEAAEHHAKPSYGTELEDSNHFHRTRTYPLLMHWLWVTSFNLSWFACVIQPQFQDTSSILGWVLSKG